MRTRVSGFTLIEAMVVMSIIGVLASVAIPEFNRFLLRSKQGERAVLLSSIRNAVEDYYMREAHFPRPLDPANPSAGSTIWLSANPSWAAPGTAKRPWRYVSFGDDWQALTLTVEGGVYYRYWAQGDEAGQQHEYWLIADGDLDGDGVLDQMQKLYQYLGIEMLHVAGSSDPNATWEWRFPGNDLTF